MNINLSDRLSELLLHTGGILPEISLTVGMLVLSAADLMLPARNRNAILSAIAGAACLTALYFLYLLHSSTPVDISDTLFVRTLFLDLKAVSAQMTMCIAGIVIILFSHEYYPHPKNSERTGKLEFLLMLLGGLLGSCLLARANHLILIYICLETVSLTSYLLTAYRREERFSAEAAVKFFLYGSFASALFLYGVSLQYGITGSLFLSDLPTADLPLAQVLIWAGLAYKVGLAPFHFWMPDATEGASMPAGAFLLTIPKVAGFTVLYRWFSFSFSSGSDTFVYILVIASLLSMVWGNLGAFGQKSYKRMLAYSSVAHTGYLSAGLLTGTYLNTGVYLVFYTGMTLAAFGVGMLLEKRLGTERIPDWRGWGSGLPFYAFLLTAVMLALTGLPPTAGFAAKLQLLSGLLNQTHEFYTVKVVLTIGILLNTVASLFYYLAGPSEMILKKRTSDAPAPPAISVSPIPLTVGLTGVLVLFCLLGLFFLSGDLSSYFGS